MNHNLSTIAKVTLIAALALPGFAMAQTAPAGAAAPAGAGGTVAAGAGIGAGLSTGAIVGIAAAIAVGAAIVSDNNTSPTGTTGTR